MMKAKDSQHFVDPHAARAALRDFQTADEQLRIAVDLQLAGRHAEAETAYRECIAQDPRSAPAWNNLGVLLSLGGRTADAQEAWRATLRIDPDHPQALAALGGSLVAARPLRALRLLRRAVELQPDNATGWNNLGLCLQALSRTDEAVAAFERSVQLEPRGATALGNLGAHLYGCQLYEEAEAVLLRAVAIAPTAPEAVRTLYMALLGQGRLQEAWPYQESALASFVGADAPKGQRWRGEPLQGRHLLVWQDQGHGDEIQFVRFVPHLKRAGAARLTVACAPELHALFAQAPGVDHVVDRQLPSTQDLWIPTSAVPAALGVSLATIPAALPYLHAPDARLQLWQQRLPRGLKVGVAWRGSPAHPNDLHRSIRRLETLAPLWTTKDIQFVSLQKGAGSEQDAAVPRPGQPLLALGDQIQDFADMAAVISQLDLVISVDTAVVHLAGALGKPVWVLLPAWRTDWRWLRERRDSPWYPGVMRLYRQAEQGVWEPVVEQVAADLAEWMQQARRATQPMSAGPAAPSAGQQAALPVPGLLAEAQRLQASGNADEAKLAYVNALRIDPSCLEALNNLAHLLLREDQKLEAEALLREMLRIDPMHPQGNMNLGLLLTELRRDHEALPFARRAVALRPTHAPAWVNLAACCDACGLREEGEAACRRALELDPGNALALANLGTLLSHAGELDQAEQLYRRALQGPAKPPVAQLGLFLLLLARGHLEHAWPRFASAMVPSIKSAPVQFPRWTGEPLAGRSILVWQEQGFGDVIQFIRYAPMLKRAGARRVALCCMTQLAPLVRSAAGVDEIISADKIPDHDFWVPTIGLPPAFGSTLASIPATLPYLEAPADSVREWAPRLPRGLKVGLAWYGNPNHRNDGQRAIGDFTRLAPLWRAKGITFVRLQKTSANAAGAAIDGAAQPSLPIGDEVRDFGELSAVVSQLDLVISVDTAVAHLAGALGKPVWVLLPAWATDWRWLRDRSDSPWYPGVMRLFRQNAPGDWASLLDTVATELEAWTVDKTAAARAGMERAQRSLALQQLHDEASSLERAGRWDEAAATYRRILGAEPQSAVARNNLANALIRTGHLDQAEDALRDLLRGSPDDPYANFNLGIVLICTRREHDALPYAQRAVDLLPANAQAWNNLGLCLTAATRAREARAAYGHALRLAPADPEALLNLGGLLSHCGLYQEAESVVRQATSVTPQSREAQLMLFFLLLGEGRLHEAWPLYDTAMAPAIPAPLPGSPRWCGEPLAGRSILIWHEQGHGDTIHFIRYAPLLKRRGASRVTLACPPELAALLVHAHGVDDVVSTRPLPQRDTWVSTLGLPAAFRTPLSAIPARIPYLGVPEAHLHKWRLRLPSGTKVGLAWRGSPLHANDAQRSVHDIRTLAPLWRVPGISFVSLQHAGTGSEEGAPTGADQPLVDPGESHKDFADLAGLISQVDLVISVDTAVGHLAGAMGKPTWLLLPAWRTDWRWMRRRTDSPWYPRVMRLYRQDVPGQWSATVERVAADLAVWAASSAETSQVRR